MRVWNEMMIREHPRGHGVRQNLPTPAPLPQPPSRDRAVRYHTGRRRAAGPVLVYSRAPKAIAARAIRQAKALELLRTNSRFDRTRDPVMLSTDSLAEVPSRTSYVFAAEADADAGGADDAVHGADELG